MAYKFQLGTAKLSGSIEATDDGSFNLGSSGKEFENLFIDGTANIDSLVADTADIDGGTIDAAVIGGTTPAAGSFLAVVGTTATFSSTLDANGDVDLGGSTANTVTVTGRFDSDLVPSGGNARDLGSSSLKWKDLYLDGVAYVDDIHAADCDIDGGNIDGTVIGAASAAAITGTRITATTAFTGSISGSLVQGTMANFGSGGISTQGNIEGVEITATSKMLITADKAGGGVGSLTLGAGGDAAISFDGGGDEFLVLDVPANKGTRFDVNGTTKGKIDINSMDIASGMVYEINGTSVLSNNTLGAGVINSSLTSVGTLVAGVWNAGAIDTGTDDITTGGLLKLDVDADANDNTADSADGRLAIGASEDLNLYHNTNSYIANKVGNLILEAPTSAKHSLTINGTEEAHVDADGMDLASGNDYRINNVSVLSNTTLGTSVVNSSLTSVGTITSGVWNAGAINIGSNTLVAGQTTVSSLTASYARIEELDVITINSVAQTNQTLEIVDKLIIAASGAASANAADGGLQIGGTNGSDTVASVLYDHGNTALDFNIGGTTEIRLEDGVLRPETDNDVDLGASGAEFKDLYINGVAYLDAIDFNGTAISATGAEINLVDGSSAGTIVNSKAVIYGSGGEVNATKLQVGGVDITATPGEINLLDAGLGSSVALQATDAFIMFDDSSGDAATKVKVQDMADFVGENLAEKITRVAAGATHNHAFATHGSILSVDASGGAVTINLPAVSAANDGKVLKIKKYKGSDNVVINRSGAGQSIDDQVQIILASDHSAISLIFDYNSGTDPRYFVL